MNLELTNREAKLLTELLGLDLESIGFDDDGDIETLNGIHDKLEEGRRKTNDQTKKEKQ